MFGGPNSGGRGPGGQGLDASSGLQDSTAALDNKHNAEQRERYYATVRKPAQTGLERIPGELYSYYCSSVGWQALDFSGL